MNFIPDILETKEICFNPVSEESDASEATSILKTPLQCSQESVAQEKKTMV